MIRHVDFVKKLQCAIDKESVACAYFFFAGVRVDRRSGEAVSATASSAAFPDVAAWYRRATLAIVAAVIGFMPRPPRLPRPPRPPLGAVAATAAAAAAGALDGMIGCLCRRTRVEAGDALESS